MFFRFFFLKTLAYSYTGREKWQVQQFSWELVIMKTAKPGHWKPLFHIFQPQHLISYCIRLWPLLFPACIDKYSWVRADPMGMGVGKVFYEGGVKTSISGRALCLCSGLPLYFQRAVRMRGNPKYSVLIISFCLKESIFLKIEGWIIQIIPLIPRFALESVAMTFLLTEVRVEWEGDVSDIYCSEFLWNSHRIKKMT